MSWLKRTVLMITATVLFITAALPSYAALSPQHHEDPTVIVDGDKMLIWTWFEDRATILYESDREAMDAAYSEVVQAESNETKPAESNVTKQAEINLGNLVPGISAKAEAVGVSLNDCKVSDLFDLSAYKKENGIWVKDPDRGSVTIKKTSYRFKNFVCLLHRKKDGKWEIVDNAKVVNNDTIEFTVRELSPFAIVSWGNSGVGTVDGKTTDTGVGTGVGTGGKRSPKTGDNTLKWIGTTVLGAVLLACAAFVLVAAARKKRQ